MSTATTLLLKPKLEEETLWVSGTILMLAGFPGALVHLELCMVRLKLKLFPLICRLEVYI